ncbi:MAG TPA: type II toxin-antitoxin system VapC family toxin [Longimicrobium sp.]|nr:type II toxin-antitoxin system VapC family toxin [Longimicrobium sp.]
MLDTNIYIRALRNPDAERALHRFAQRHVTATHLSSVVFHELLLGATGPKMAKDLAEGLAAPFTRTKRMVVPSHRAWEQAAETIAQLGWHDGLNRSTLPRGFVNDVLIAASCRENGLTLVTENVWDFSRIQKRIQFDYVAPWPELEE